MAQAPQPSVLRRISQVTYRRDARASPYSYRLKNYSVTRPADLIAVALLTATGQTNARAISRD